MSARGVAGTLSILLVILGGSLLPAAATEGDAAEPRVIVAVPDTGINPYHERFRRPDLTEEPCTYLDGFPCGLEKLELTLDASSYEEAVEADAAVWDGVEEGKWYWIPGTVFVAVHCDEPTGSRTPGADPGHCILDEHGHGTATTSSVLAENPDALLAASEGSRVAPFAAGGIPVDVFSHSWGNVVPIPGHPDVYCVNHKEAPLFVTGAGNDPRSTLLDCTKGDPAVISVGGAYAEDDSEEALAAKQPDVVSYFCRPTARSGSLDGELENACGTSFAAPTVAGALSKVVLAVREQSGYTGGIVDGDVDPVHGLGVDELRTTLKETATYDPEPRYPNTFPTRVPLNPLAPCLQWGWGFYDGLVAETTIDVLLNGASPPERSAACDAYLAAVDEAKATLYGNPGVWPAQQDDAGSGGDAPDTPEPDVPIEPGVVYEGTLASNADHYALDAEAGEAIQAKVRGSVALFEILGPDGERISDSRATFAGFDVLFPQSVEAEAQESGVHYLSVRYFVPQQYGFAVGIDEDAPEPGLLGQPLPPPPPMGS